jgi:hypothetical protein
MDHDVTYNAVFGEKILVYLHETKVHAHESFLHMHISFSKHRESTSITLQSNGALLVEFAPLASIRACVHRPAVIEGEKKLTAAGRFI